MFMKLKIKNIYFLTGLDNKKTEQNLIFQNIEKDINVLNDNTRVITIHGKVNNISDVKLIKQSFKYIFTEFR